jgi:hypothetical protein
LEARPGQGNSVDRFSKKQNKKTDQEKELVEWLKV